MRVPVSESRPNTIISGWPNRRYSPVEYENHSSLSSESVRGATLITCHPYFSMISRNLASARESPSRLVGSNILDFEEFAETLGLRAAYWDLRLLFVVHF